MLDAEGPAPEHSTLVKQAAIKNLPKSVNRAPVIVPEEGWLPTKPQKPSKGVRVAGTSSSRPKSGSKKVQVAGVSSPGAGSGGEGGRRRRMVSITE